MLVEGVHFLRDDPPDLLAKKALRVNLSDLAAKGATPMAICLACRSRPGSATTGWRDFAAGLAEDQKRFAMSLSGGDTTATPGPLTLSITAFGTVPTGRMIRRQGARPRDPVFVTGTHRRCRRGARGAERRGCRPVRFRPCRADLALSRPGAARRASGGSCSGIASSALDVSDGLLADLGHIAEVSEVRIAVDAARIPISAATRALWGQGPETMSAPRRRETITRSRSRRRPRPGRASRNCRARRRGDRRNRPRGSGKRRASPRRRGKPIPVPRTGFTHF